MKPEIAIVQPAVDLLEQRIIVALAEERQADNSAARWEQQAAAARETARVRRREIGEMLTRARAAWPERGPNAKGWGEFLKRVGLDQSTAWRYMHPEQAKSEAEPADGADFMQLHENPAANGDRDAPPANVIGGSGETARGAYCTPKKYADAVGPWDLDPFSNPRSHIAAAQRCMLEDGGDGLGADGEPGSWIGGGERPPHGCASESTRVYLQPPYGHGFVERVVTHYGHTRFCALLRFAPDTGWFAALWPRVAAIAIPRERLPFETPGGVQLEGADEGEDRGAPFPHVFYYADERDITPAIRELCIVLRVDHPNP